MSNLGEGSEDTKYKKQISEIIEYSLVDLYGIDGYKSIIQTMTNDCGKTGKEIISNYELFTKLTKDVFGEFGDRKILDQIKSEIKRSSNKIIKNINEKIEINQIRNNSSFKIIKGYQNIFTNIAQMIEDTKDVIYITATLDYVSKMYFSSIPEKIKICEKNGGKVRLLVDMNDVKLTSFVKQFNATETKMSILPSNGIMVVQKDKKTIISDSIPLFQNSNSNFSICTNSNEMVDNIFSLCTLLWDTSKSEISNNCHYQNY